MSLARRLNNQAISSSILTTMALAFFSSSCSRRSFSLSAKDLPDNVNTIHENQFACITKLEATVTYQHTLYQVVALVTLAAQDDQSPTLYQPSFLSRVPRVIQEG